MISPTDAGGACTGESPVPNLVAAMKGSNVIRPA